MNILLVSLLVFNERSHVDYNMYELPFVNSSMARGQQKIQSQQKNAAKAAAAKKAKGHDQKTAAAKALTFKCAVCMVSACTNIQKCSLHGK